MYEGVWVRDALGQYPLYTRKRKDGKEDRGTGRRETEVEKSCTIKMNWHRSIEGALALGGNETIVRRSGTRKTQIVCYTLEMLHYRFLSTKIPFYLGYIANQILQNRQTQIFLTFALVLFLPLLEYNPDKHQR